MITPRAVVIGLSGCVAMAAATPINDWWLHNTLLYSQSLPLGVTFLAVLLGLVINPLLGPRRLRAGECVVVVAMLLVLGGVVSSGLMRYLPAVMVGPAKVIPSKAQYDVLADRGAGFALPPSHLVGVPTSGDPKVNDAEYRHVVDGFISGADRRPVVQHRAQVAWTGPDGARHEAIALGGETAHQARARGETFLDLDDHDRGGALLGHQPGEWVDTPTGRWEVLAVTPPGVPWHAWWGPFLHWLPLIASALLICLMIAALVRRQWIENERLPFPIAHVIRGFLAEPDGPHLRLPALVRNRAFWIAAAVPVVVLGSQILAAWWPTLVAIPTHFNYIDPPNQIFAGPEFQQVYVPRWLYVVHIYFTVVALTFFLPVDLGFSLWFFFIAANLIYAVLRSQGLPVGMQHVSQMTFGGYAALAAFILWIGRRQYLALLRAAVSRPTDPLLREAVPYVRLLLFAIAGLVLALVAMGAQPWHAILVALIFMGLVLVMARIVAEAGVPYIDLPNNQGIASLIFSVTGFAAPVAALAPLTLIGVTLLADGRENLLPYAVNAEHLAHSHQPRRRPWMLLLGSAVAIGVVVSGVTMIALAYLGGGQNWLDGWAFMKLEQHALGPVASGISNPEAATADDGAMWLSYGLGAALVAGLSLGRLLLAWWPLHPIGFVCCSSYATWTIWFSFLIGWAAKVLVMRYGGTALYQRVRPAAYGLIAAEAVVAGGYLLVCAVLKAWNVPLPDVKFLPG